MYLIVCLFLHRAGVGSGMLLVCFLLMCYCSVLITWSDIYIMQSFYNPLPWEECPPNTAPTCTNITVPIVVTEPPGNISLDSTSMMTLIPNVYYFE